MSDPLPTQKRMVTKCPFCGDALAISRLTCSGCQTQIDSTLSIPPFFRLPPDLQYFALVFLHCRGNIREVEKAMGISYPTVCKRLELVNELLGSRVERKTQRNEVLDRLERGEITAQEASQLLKER